jgi:hypothetical protein
MVGRPQLALIHDWPIQFEEKRFEEEQDRYNRDRCNAGESVVVRVRSPRRQVTGSCRSPLLGTRSARGPTVWARSGHGR